MSVGSKKDTEDADLRREGVELDEDPEHEHAELSRIYVDPKTASRVAEPLMSATRVAFWSALAMGLTTLVGRLFGAVV